MLLLEVASPIILTIGIVGNLVSFCIFRSDKMKHLPTFKFLSYLSLIDCLYILIGIPHIMAITFFNYDFRNTTNLICSIHSFLTIYLSHLSSNVLAAVGVLRCVKLTSKKSNFNLRIKMKAIKNSNENVVYSPTKLSMRQRYFNSFNVIFFTILFVLFLIDSHYLYFMRLNENFECYPNDTNFYFEFYSFYWPWIDLFMYSYIPFLVMITSTIIISYKLYKSSKSLIKRRKKNAIKINKLKTNQINLNNLGIHTQTTRFKLNNLLIRRSKRNNQIYKLLISINITFFVLVTPIVLTNSLQLLNRDSGSLFDLIYILAYLNHCLNFLFYGFSCSLYRSVLLDKLNYQNSKNT